MGRKRTDETHNLLERKRDRGASTEVRTDDRWMRDPLENNSLSGRRKEVMTQKK